MELEKWQRIADAIKAKGGSRYPSSAVQTKFKEMARKSNGVAGMVGAIIKHCCPGFCYGEMSSPN